MRVVNRQFLNSAFLCPHSLPGTGSWTKIRQGQDHRGHSRSKKCETESVKVMEVHPKICFPPSTWFPRNRQSRQGQDKVRVVRGQLGSFEDDKGQRGHSKVQGQSRSLEFILDSAEIIFPHNLTRKRQFGQVYKVKDMLIKVINRKSFRVK